MTCEVYIDVVFFVNLAMDFAVLAVLNRMLGDPGRGLKAGGRRGGGGSLGLRRYPGAGPAPVGQGLWDLCGGGRPDGGGGLPAQEP